MKLKLKLVDCKPEHFEFLRLIRNKPQIRNKMVHQQLDYLNRDYMKKHQKYFKICFLGKIPVGYIRVMDGDIGLIVEPKYQRRGVGTFMLNNIHLFKDKKKFAKIKPNNVNSLALFKKAGYKVKYYILEKEDSEKGDKAKLNNNGGKNGK